MFVRLNRKLNLLSLLPGLLATVISLSAANVAAQDILRSAPAPPAEEGLSEGKIAPVVVDGVTLFYVRGVLAFPADQRARDIAKRIEEVAADRSFSP